MHSATHQYLGERTQSISDPTGQRGHQKAGPDSAPCLSLGWFQSVPFSCNTPQLWVLQLPLSSVYFLAHHQTWEWLWQGPKLEDSVQSEGSLGRLRSKLCSLANRQMGWKQSTMRSSWSTRTLYDKVAGFWKWGDISHFKDLLNISHLPMKVWFRPQTEKLAKDFEASNPESLILGWTPLCV